MAGAGVPLLVAAAVVALSEHRLAEAAAGLVAVAVLAWAARRPGRGACVLIVFLPIQALGSGLALGILPSSLVHELGGIKELMALSVALSALVDISRTQRRLDPIDKLALAYVAMASLGLVVPELFSSRLLRPNPLTVRVLAWRADCAYVLVFLAFRHAPFSERARRSFVRLAIAMAVLTGVVAVYQRLDPLGFQRWLFTTANAIGYQFAVLHNNPVNALVSLQYELLLHPLRVGSVELSPFDMADFLLVPFSLCLARLAQGWRRIGTFAVIGLIGISLIFSDLRADALGAAVVTAIAVLPTPARPVVARLRILAAVAAAAMILLPNLVGSRYLGGQHAAGSNQGHLNEISFGITVIYDHPFGLGLGNTAGVGTRFVVDSSHNRLGAGVGSFVSDNAITQVGDELGIQALLPWLGLVGAVVLALRRRARSGDFLAQAGFFALVAILVTGQFHEVFLSYDVSWPVWALAGLGLRRSRTGDDLGAREGGAQGTTPVVVAPRPPSLPFAAIPAERTPAGAPSTLAGLPA